MKEWMRYSDSDRSPDLKNSAQVIAAAGQGGIGMPDRDYYTRDDEKSKQLRADYIQHVTNMFKLLGDNETTAAAEAKSVMDIETRLAKASMPRVDLPRSGQDLSQDGDVAISGACSERELGRLLQGNRRTNWFQT